MKTVWIVGTRGSKLALKQTEIVIAHLREAHPGHQFVQKIIRTTGDTIWDKPLHLIGGKGLFVKEIEDELITGTIDLAVHSMKDVPTDLGKELAIGAVLKREDPRDVFISLRHKEFADMKNGGKIGTNSLRRKSQILSFSRDIEVVPLRGNVDTRIRKMESESLDGIILAYAGVARMGYEGHIREILPISMMVPPSGQGAIGVETRAEPELLAMIREINHEHSLQEVSIERRLQVEIGGGCNVPLGINASIAGGKLTLSVSYGTEEGDLLIRDTQTDDVDKAGQMITKAFDKVLHAKGELPA